MTLTVNQLKQKLQNAQIAFTKTARKYDLLVLATKHHLIDAKFLQQENDKLRFKNIQTKIAEIKKNPPNHNIDATILDAAFAVAWHTSKLETKSKEIIQQTIAQHTKFLKLKRQNEYQNDRLAIIKSRLESNWNANDKELDPYGNAAWINKQQETEAKRLIQTYSQRNKLN